MEVHLPVEACMLGVKGDKHQTKLSRPWKLHPLGLSATVIFRRYAAKAPSDNSGATSINNNISGQLLGLGSESFKPDSSAQHRCNNQNCTTTPSSTCDWMYVPCRQLGWWTARMLYGQNNSEDALLQATRPLTIQLASSPNT
jgi:hypothetical protein